MRKIIVVDLLVIVFVATMVLLFGIIEGTYTRKVKVTKVENDVVYFRDDFGDIWEWEIEEGETFEKGEQYRLTFGSVGTDSIYDDEIMKYKKL